MTRLFWERMAKDDRGQGLAGIRTHPSPLSRSLPSSGSLFLGGQVSDILSTIGDSI